MTTFPSLFLSASAPYTFTPYLSAVTAVAPVPHGPVVRLARPNTFAAVVANGQVACVHCGRMFELCDVVRHLPTPPTSVIAWMVQTTHPLGHYVATKYVPLGVTVRVECLQ